jgi:ligand-binding sensor domain-containing protein
LSTHRFYIVFILLLFFQQLCSQPPKRYSFAHYGNASGLASNEVNEVIQDNEGYIWIATTNGLQRFDGVRFITFRNQKGNPLSIPGNVVTQLLIDHKKNLWIQAGSGRVGIFDTKSFTFHETAIHPSKDLYINSDKQIIEDEDGNIMMILWNNELLTYNEKKNEFATAYNFIYFPSDWNITGVCQLKGTKKYIFGSGKGIAIYNRQTEHLSYPGHNTDNEPLVEKIGKITSASNFTIDKNNRIWFDTWELGASTLCCYDPKNNSIVLDHYSFQPLLNAYHEIKGVTQQRNGNIWAKGLNVFGHYIEREKRFQLVYNGFENEQSISFNRVNSLFEDVEGNIWVGTDINGLYRFNPQGQFFTNVRQVNRGTGKPGNGSAMSFMPAKNGDLFVGTWEDGLYRVDSNLNTVPVGLSNLDKITPAMWGMYASKDSNTIWMGAQPGIWRIDQAKKLATFYNPTLIKNRTIRQIAEDNFGNLWMGTQSLGLFKWSAEKGKHNFDEGVTSFKEIPPCMITRIITDKSGHVWVGTTTLGTYVIDPSADTIVLHLSTKEPEERRLLWDGIASIIQYDDTTMIIAASSLSIYNTVLKKITKTIVLPDLVSGTIASIERDRQGYVWMSTTGGLFRVNIRSKIFIRFDRTDGIANDRFIIAASHVLPDGKMLFGADNQFVIFDPAEVQINDVSPDIKLTGFKLASESLNVDSLMKKGIVELEPGDNSISIEFSGLNYTAAYIIKYKLEGLDKDWKIADRNYQAIYSYLPPATYTLKLQSADAEGHPGTKLTELVIKVKPPFWKTWWFFCILALVAAAIFYWLDKQRVNRLVALQNVRSDIASNLHDEVNTTLNNINLLSEMARIKADKDIDRSKEFIEQISQKSHNMILAMDDILWSIDPQNDSMEKSLLRMMEFADVLKNLFGAHIELALDKRVRSLKLDMKTRHDVFLIFKEALRVIVEFSGGKETLIHIDLFKNKLSIKLQDATANLDKNVTQIESCIKEMNGKAALINADLDVQYDKKGIAIILLVPVK